MSISTAMDTLYLLLTMLILSTGEFLVLIKGLKHSPWTIFAKPTIRYRCIDVNFMHVISILHTGVYGRCDTGVCISVYT